MSRSLADRIEDASGAAALLARDARLVGIDYLSIGDPDAHMALLDRGAGVIEGLDLRTVEPGPYSSPACR
jgi:kynurenine formamidase